MSVEPLVAIALRHPTRLGLGCVAGLSALLLLRLRVVNVFNDDIVFGLQAVVWSTGLVFWSRLERSEKSE